MNIRSLVFSGVCFLLICGALDYGSVMQQVPKQSLENASQSAYNSILYAEQSGANISGLVSKFNNALGLAKNGEYYESSFEFSSIISNSSKLRTSAIAESQVSGVITYISIVLISTLISIVAYLILAWREKSELGKVFRMNIRRK